MADRTRPEALLAFLETIDRFKSIYRAAYLSDMSRHESDAEHVWHLCMYAWLLHGETALEADLGHSLELILAHDLVEIYAGDTPLHSPELHHDKQAREAEAADRLFMTLPEEPAAQLRSWWEEFVQGETAEARFVSAIDLLQAFAQNVFAGGQTWRDFQVAEEVSRERNRRAMEADPSLAELFEILYRRAAEGAMWG